MSISVAVIDDDEKQLNIIKSHFASAEETSEHKFKVDYFTDGLSFFEKFRDDYDILMLDIEMPLLDGVTLAKKIRQTGSRCSIIFITNMPQYAIEGYEVEATAYILKPIKLINFTEAVKRALKRVSAQHTESANIVLSGRSGIKSIASADVYYIEAMGHNIIFHTLDGEYNDRTTLNGLEEKLKEANFARCNSCYLVNLKFVDDISNNTVTVNGKELIISRNKKKTFIEKYMEYIRKN